MRPGPKVAKRCRLSEGYRSKGAWARIGFVASDPNDLSADCQSVLVQTADRFPSMTSSARAGRIPPAE
jgi:hypothetical protein